MSAEEQLASRVEELEAELLHLIEAVDSDEDAADSVVKQAGHARGVLFGDSDVG